MTSPEPDPIALGRRRLLLGTGAAALVAASLRGAELAAAEPGPAPDPTGHRSSLEAAAAKVTPSGPLSGYVYRSLSWADFTPEQSDRIRDYGGYGAYAVGGAGALWATMDIPAGSIVRDIEWYVSNASGAPVVLRGRRWLPGDATFAHGLVDDEIASSAAGVRARRAIVSASNQNPFAPGVKLALGFESTGSTTQIAGARVGMTGGGGAIGMRPIPYRAYDSRDPDKGILVGGSTRTVTVPGFASPAGTAALIINLTATGASANGYLRVYAANAAAPTISSINFAGQSTALANGLIVGISSARQLKVYASSTTHVIIDVLGTVA